MRDRLLHMYDCLRTHRRWMWSALTVILVPLFVLAITLRYNEDIVDFLPLEDEDREAFTAFQSQQSASRMVLIVEGKDEIEREQAIEELSFRLSPFAFHLFSDPSDQLQAFYAQMPYFIEDTVYDSLDSLFTPEAVRAALQRDKAILATPGAGILTTAIQSDPLGLVPISNFQSQIANERSYAFLDSPYGSTETRHNAALVDSLNVVTQSVAQQYPHLNIRWIGAPFIAVGNARQIKLDSLLCIAMSLVCIIALLAYSFPRRRDILLIVLSVSFGWLVGMAVLRVVTPMVSAVVLGIGSVLIGIAVNYPLHILVHQRYTASVRQTLHEVLSPLVVGNITTVGAFLALIPLKATAMRHLGVFAAAMLIGTIVFCIFILPHLMSEEPAPVREIKIPKFKSKFKAVGTWLIVGMTVILGTYSVYCVMSDGAGLFNPNPSCINYMTDQQRADIAFFDSVANPQRVIAAHQDRAARWITYWHAHDADSVIAIIDREAAIAGFRPEVFAPFYQTITDWQPAQLFDITKLTQGLSDNFDYIGIACSLIVFCFLWLSFRSIWIALIAFIPMVLSWGWIIAIMQLFGLQFNIVNIILATFIFGQGDDYTIFMVEGLLFERRTGKTILPQYRQSILLSALIMLIGIGVLVFAVHPAMHSLGVVTLIGMTVVFLMAVTIPPILFRFYPKGNENGKTEN